MSDAGLIRVAFRGTLGRFALDAAFAVPAAGVTALFGPSGCGKTTMLRCIAGLTRQQDGLCLVGGEVWQEGATFRPTCQRPIGYVFQEPSLFPHLSVERNLRYGAPRRGSGRIGFAEVTDLLGLGHLLTRSPHHLSGGERQRVAIGRALLSQPRLLLMDEPLSALDRSAKAEILPFLQRLTARFALPMIYVSHDITEIEQLADHLVLMEAGRVVAAGKLADLQVDPAHKLALDRDAAAALEAIVESCDTAYGMATLAVAGARFQVPASALAVGERHRLLVSAGDVSLALDPPTRTTITNSLAARILSATLLERHEILAVLGLGAPDGAKILARVTRRSWESLGLRAGMDVFALVKAVALVQKRNGM